MFRGPSDRGAPAVDQMPETRVRAIFLKRKPGHPGSGLFAQVAACELRPALPPRGGMLSWALLRPADGAVPECGSARPSDATAVSLCCRQPREILGSHGPNLAPLDGAVA